MHRHTHTRKLVVSQEHYEEVANLATRRHKHNVRSNGEACISAHLRAHEHMHTPNRCGCTYAFMCMWAHMHRHKKIYMSARGHTC